jgi:hypothetical protein
MLPGSLGTHWPTLNWTGKRTDSPIEPEGHGLEEAARRGLMGLLAHNERAY